MDAGMRWPQRTVWVVVLVSLFLALAGCKAPSSATVTLDDDRDIVAIRKGGTLTVDLESNPTTGYRWSVITQPSILSRRGEPEYVQPETTGDVVGAPGIERFTFDGILLGTDVLEFAYARSWETTSPEKTFKITVSVQ